MRDDHRFLDFEIKGSAEVDHTKHRLDLLPCYLYQSQYTKPDDGLEAFYDSIKGKCTGTASDKAEYICNILSDTIGYEKGFTDTTTTAAQAFALKKLRSATARHIRGWNIGRAITGKALTLPTTALSAMIIL